MHKSAESWGVVKPPSLVIFDLDGTLIDTLAGLTYSVNAMRCQLGLAPLPLESVRSAIGKGSRNLVRRCLPEGDARVDEGLALFFAHNGGNLAAGTSLYPGAVELLEVLCSSGTPMALVSNKNTVHCNRLLELFGVARFFRAVLGGDAEEEFKPSPMPLLAAVARCGAEPETSLMIGDSCNDFEAARGCGIRSIGCRYGYGEPWELELADARITSLDDLLPLPWGKEKS